MKHSAPRLFAGFLLLLGSTPVLNLLHAQPAPFPRFTVSPQPQSEGLIPEQGTIVEQFIYPNGGVLALGFTAERNRGRGFLLRVFPDGRLDESFGNGGIITLPGRNGNRPYHMRLDGRGRILVAGFEYAHNPNDIGRPGTSRAAVYRFLPNGQVDEEWGKGGTLYIPAVVSDSRWVSMLDLEVLPGNWVAIGFIHLHQRAQQRGFPDTHLAGVMVVNEDGEPHPEFGEEGIALPPTEEPLHFTALRILRMRDTGFLLYGRAQTHTARPPGNWPKAFFGRITPQGTWDTRVGDGKGYTVLLLGEDAERASVNQTTLTHARELPDGRIAAAGYWLSSSLDRKFDSFVAMYRPDGTLDRRFGGRDTGVSEVIRTTQPDWAFSLDLLPGGDFLVGGTNARGGYIQRLSGDGRRVAWKHEGLSHNNIDFRAALAPNASTIVTGGQGRDPASLLLQRHDNQGRQDRRFGGSEGLRLFLHRTP